MKKPLIPFSILPFSWGMKGKTREIAQAEYELSGKMLDLRLLEISKSELKSSDYLTKLSEIHLKYKDITQFQHDYTVAELIENDYDRQVTLAKLSHSNYELEIELISIDQSHQKLSETSARARILDVDLKYKKITEAEYYRGKADMIEDPTNRALAFLELDLKEHKITENKYQKEKATLNKEPWVNVLSISYDKLKPEEGSFELDWNDFFVESLEAAGYSGSSSDEVVNIWFLTTCKNIAMEEFGGVGTFDEDVTANLESQDGSSPGRKTHK